MKSLDKGNIEKKEETIQKKENSGKQVGAFIPWPELLEKIQILVMGSALHMLNSFKFTRIFLISNQVWDISN